MTPELLAEIRARRTAAGTKEWSVESADFMGDCCTQWEPAKGCTYTHEATCRSLSPEPFCRHPGGTHFWYGGEGCLVDDDCDCDAECDGVGHPYFIINFFDIEQDEYNYLSRPRAEFVANAPQDIDDLLAYIAGRRRGMSEQELTPPLRLLWGVLTSESGQGQVVPYARLAEAVGYLPGDAGAAKKLTAHGSKLRATLGLPQTRLVNVQGQGYALVGEGHTLQAPELPAGETGNNLIRLMLAASGLSKTQFEAVVHVAEAMGVRE